MEPISLAVLTVAGWVFKFAADSTLQQFQSTTSNVVVSQLRRIVDRFRVDPPEQSPIPGAVESSFRSVCFLLCDRAKHLDDEARAWSNRLQKLARKLDVGSIASAPGIAAGPIRTDDPDVAAAFSRAFLAWLETTGLGDPPPGVLAIINGGVSSDLPGASTLYDLYLAYFDEMYRDNKNGLRAAVDSMRTELIHRAILALLDAMGPGANEQRIEAALDVYADAIVRNCSPMALPLPHGPGQVTTVDLNRIFVDLPLEPPNPEVAAEGADLEQEAERSFLERRLVERERDAAAVPDRDSVPDAVKTLSISTCLERNPRVLVTGGPGTGKSTVARFVAAHYARARVLHSHDRGDERSSSGLSADDPGPALPRIEWLPVLLRCRDMRSATAQEMTLGSQVSSMLERMDVLPTGLLDDVADTLRSRVENGRALLIIDGLDELPDELRPLLLGLIGRANSVLVTSRHIGMDEATSERGARLTHYEIGPLDPERRHQFIERWGELCPELPASPPNRSDDLWAELSDTNLEKLGRAIQPLTMMAQIHTIDGAIPPGRDVIYQRALRDLLLSREHLRDRFGPIGVPDVWPGMTELALQMTDKGMETWDCAEAARAIDGFIARVLDDPAVEPRLKERLRRHLPDGTTWLLVAVNFAILNRSVPTEWRWDDFEQLGDTDDSVLDGVVEFCHAAFKEYCAAHAPFSPYGSAHLAGLGNLPK